MEIKPKAKVYIDGANIFYAQKKIGWSLDWSKIKEVLGKDREVIEWRYYVAVKDGEDQMQSYLRYLDAIKFTAVTKSLKKINLQPTGYMYKANFDVEMAVDILLDKASVDEVILFSGDSDFSYLIRKLRDAGKKVTVFAFRQTIAWELKLAASKVIYLDKMKDEIMRK